MAELAPGPSVEVARQDGPGSRRLRTRPGRGVQAPDDEPGEVDETGGDVQSACHGPEIESGRSVGWEKSMQAAE